MLAIFDLLAIILLGFQPAGAPAPHIPTTSNTTTYSNPVAKSNATNASGLDNNGHPYHAAQIQHPGGTVPASSPPAV